MRHLKTFPKRFTPAQMRIYVVKNSQISLFYNLFTAQFSYNINKN